MRVEIEALKGTVDSMRGVIVQLTSTVHRLASNSSSIPQDEQNRLVEAVRAIDTIYGSKKVHPPESRCREEVNMLVPFDDHDYSYLDELFPEKDSSSSDPCFPLVNMLSPISEERLTEDLRMPLASAALYAFIAAHVNTAGSSLSQKRDIEL